MMQFCSCVRTSLCSCNGCGSTAFSLSQSLDFLANFGFVSIFVAHRPQHASVIQFLVCRQTLHHSGHLLVGVYPEAPLFGHTCELHVLGIQLLLHNLLQGLEHQCLCVFQRERLWKKSALFRQIISTNTHIHGWLQIYRSITHLVVLVLQLSLCTLTSTSDSLRIIPVESSTGLSVVQTGAILIIPRNKKGNTERPAHDALLTVGALAEPQRQVADGLGAGLDPQALVVVEGVALALDAGVLDHAPGVGLQAGHGAADVAVDLDDLLDGGGLEQGGGDALLDAEDDALVGGDADGRAAQLDGLEGVLDLEEPAFGGEGVDTPVCAKQTVSQVSWVAGRSHDGEVVRGHVCMVD